MQIVLFFALGSSAAAVLISQEQKSNTSVAHFGPGACVSAWVGTGSHCVVQTACSEQPAFASYALRLICVDKDGGRVLHSFETGGFEVQEIFDTLIVCDKCEAGDVDEVPQVFLAAKPDEKTLDEARLSDRDEEGNFSEAGQSLSSPAPAPIAAAAAAPEPAAAIVEVFPADPALEKTKEKITVLEEEVQNLTNTAAVISQTINLMREKMLGSRNSSKVLRGSSRAKGAQEKDAAAPAPMAAAAPAPAAKSPAPGPAPAVSRLAGKESDAAEQSPWTRQLEGALSPIASGLKDLFPGGGGEEHDKERENTGRVVESTDEASTEADKANVDAQAAGRNAEGPRKVREAETPGRLAAPDSKADKDGAKESKVVKEAEKADHELEVKVDAEAEQAGREAEEVALAALRDDIDETKPTLPPAAKAKPSAQSVEHMPKAKQSKIDPQTTLSVAEKQLAVPVHDSNMHLHNDIALRVAVKKHASMAKKAVQKDGHSSASAARHVKDPNRKHATQKVDALPKRVSLAKQPQVAVPLKKHDPLAKKAMQKDIVASATKPAVDSNQMHQPAVEPAAVQPRSKVQPHHIRTASKIAAAEVVKFPVQPKSDSKIAVLAQAKSTVSSSESEDLANVDNDQLADLLVESMEE